VIVKLRDIMINVDGMVCINLIYDILVNYIFFRCITWIGCRLHSSSICDMTTYGRRPLKRKGGGFGCRCLPIGRCWLGCLADNLAHLYARIVNKYEKLLRLLRRNWNESVGQQTTAGVLWVQDPIVGHGQGMVAFKGVRTGRA